MVTDKRTQILQAALALFAEYGFRGTSTAEISKRAGVATGTLFHHFKSKEDLIEELYMDAKSGLAEYLQTAVGVNLNTREALKCLWLAFAEWAIKNEEQYRFFRHCEASPYISQSLREKGTAKMAFAYAYFEDLAKSREGNNVSTAMLIDLFSGALEGFIRHLYNNSEVRIARSQWEKAFNLCWKAFS